MLGLKKDINAWIWQYYLGTYINALKNKLILHKYIEENVKMTDECVKFTIIPT